VTNQPWQPDPKDVEALSRALCRFYQYDPDLLVSYEPSTPVAGRPGVHRVQRYTQPLWQDYAAEVQIFLNLLHERGQLLKRVEPEPELPLGDVDNALDELGGGVKLDFSPLFGARTEPKSAEDIWRETQGLRG